MIAALSLVKKLASSIPTRLRSASISARTEAVEISELIATRTRGGSTVSSWIDGQQVRFFTTDCDLKPAAEALGSAFLLPALHAQRHLTILPPVCDVWAHQFATIPGVVESWWHYPIADLQLFPCKLGERPCDETVLAFSGGVDSFYSLLRYPNRLDAIVGVLGFDVKLKDRDRAKSLEACVRSVAVERGIVPIVVSTNLRQHRLMKGTPWERTHGGALAAIGHLLSDCYGTFVISASGARVFDHPWGSHWDLDPRFGSAGLTIEHFGEHVMRSIKLMEIAKEPIVRRHLRVCWEFLNRGINCGLCEKCVRTMLALDVCGQLGHFPSFCNVHQLKDSIDKCPFTPKLAIDTYELFLKLGVSMKYQSSVRRLIERSKAHYYGNA